MLVTHWQLFLIKRLTVNTMSGIMHYPTYNNIVIAYKYGTSGPNLITYTYGTSRSKLCVSSELGWYEYLNIQRPETKVILKWFT